MRGKPIYFSVFLVLAFAACNSPSSDHNLSSKDSTGVDEDSLYTEEMMIQTPDSIDILLGLGKPEFGDLDSMLARRHIRVLVPYSPTFYYVEGKDRKGLALEEVNLFEKAIHRQLSL